jgi:hypothetical protein
MLSFAQHDGANDDIVVSSLNINLKLLKRTIRVLRERIQNRKGVILLGVIGAGFKPAPTGRFFSSGVVVIIHNCLKKAILRHAYFIPRGLDDPG